EGPSGLESVGGLLPEVWAGLFRQQQYLLEPMRPWLRRRLERWWQIKTVESGILLALCIFGPDREVLAQRLQPRLRHHTTLLVDSVVGIIETECSQEVRRLRGCHAAQEETQSPGAGSGPLVPPHTPPPWAQGSQQPPPHHPPSPRPSFPAVTWCQTAARGWSSPARAARGAREFRSAWPPFCVGYGAAGNGGSGAGASG
ncbi:hypothetical protein HGM15179_016260, partial [Zosterops borbonicus]